MIIDERMVTYINSLDTGNTPFLENLERTAKQTKVRYSADGCPSVLTPARISSISSTVCAVFST